MVLCKYFTSTDLLNHMIALLGTYHHFIGKETETQSYSNLFEVTQPVNGEAGI